MREKNEAQGLRRHQGGIKRSMKHGLFFLCHVSGLKRFFPSFRRRGEGRYKQNAFYQTTPIPSLTKEGNFKRLMRHFFLLGWVPLLSQGTMSQACSVCLGGVSSDLARGFYWGVLLLLLLPFVLAAGFVGLVVYHVRKHKRLVPSS
jgi:hypothetical protein